MPGANKDCKLFFEKMFRNYGLFFSLYHFTKILKKRNYSIILKYFLKLSDNLYIALYKISDNFYCVLYKISDNFHFSVCKKSDVFNYNCFWVVVLAEKITLSATFWFFQKCVPKWQLLSRRTQHLFYS